ncbi:MAG TPA: hypothetical protein VKG86_12200 [Terracidiphilus sp.]|nr:hypothetical protein [Terracidiphilus sp.]
MPNARVATPRARRRAIAASVLLACLFFAGGCKTSDDAAAAATQLTATAKSLTDYYSALDTILAQTDQLNAVQVVLYGIPYDDATKAQITDTRAEIQKRAALAKDLTDLAQNFAKLTGSTASTDASASAVQLETEVESLKLTKSKMGSDEQNLMKIAVGLVVTAIQEHKEREAAQGISKFTTALNGFFTKEAPDYISLNDDYRSISSSLAKSLLQNGQTDPSSFFKVALDPYGLTPEVTDSKLRKDIEKLAEAQVDQTSADLQKSQQDATDSMEKSLKQMADRIVLVANDKPMQARTAPVTLADVEKWASQFTTSTQSTATTTPAKTPASPAKTATKTK